jgi:hypothetical protein
MPNITLKNTVKNYFNINKDSDIRYVFKDVLQERWSLECNLHGTNTKLPEDIALTFLIYNLPYAYQTINEGLIKLNEQYILPLENVIP